jgi:hypothetical protein
MKLVKTKFWGKFDDKNEEINEVKGKNGKIYFVNGNN